MKRIFSIHNTVCLLEMINCLIVPHNSSVLSFLFKYKHNKSDMQAICNKISVLNHLIDKFILDFSITNSKNDNEVFQNNQNTIRKTVFFITTIMIVIVKLWREKLCINTSQIFPLSSVSQYLTLSCNLLISSLTAIVILRLYLNTNIIRH